MSKISPVKTPKMTMSVKSSRETTNFTQYYEKFRRFHMKQD